MYVHIQVQEKKNTFFEFELPLSGNPDEKFNYVGQSYQQVENDALEPLHANDPNGFSVNSQFHWENPHAQKVTQGNEKIVAELFREYLEFYKMDYTLNIFGPEANLTGSTPDSFGTKKLSLPLNNR